MRIGNGYDVHRLVAGRKLILGGVHIPHESGLLGHSDADVLVHAVIDSLLGAAALGDIGKFFPDTNQKYKNVDSLILLRETFTLLQCNNYKIINIDSIIVAQRPKLGEYLSSMASNIALVCNIDKSCVSIKATTEEKLGFTGLEQGMSAHAVCLIDKADK